MTSSMDNVFFFLGAGASVEAGVPDTKKFIFGGEGVQGFIQWLSITERSAHKDILDKILKTFDPSIEDIEFILKILHDLNSKNEIPVTKLFKDEIFSSGVEKEKLYELEDLLRQFIRENVMVKKGKIQYLSPLVEFPKPIKIFSVNYDTCIELLSLQHKLKYTDGFGLDWQPESFERDFDIKLFKLHGSIIWYLTNEGNYLKLPLSITNENKNEIRLISGEIAKPFILYPEGNKGEFAEPLNVLTNYLQNELKTASVCVVVGYSFRDENIRRIFFEMAKKNPSLRIILISPHARQIYEKMLKYFDREKTILSNLSLNNQVICWNYAFGPVLEDNYLFRTINFIDILKSAYQNARSSRLNQQGNWRANYKNCIDLAINLEDIGTLQYILDNDLGVQPKFLEDYSYIPEKDKFKILYSLAFLNLFNFNSKNYFSSFISYMNRISKFSHEYLEYATQYKEINNNHNRSIAEEDTPFDTNPSDFKEQTDKILTAIRVLKASPSTQNQLFLWIENNSELYQVINEFEDFLNIKIKLRKNVQEYHDVLIDLLDCCKKMIDIWANPNGYYNSEHVQIEAKIIEIDKMNDLLSLFDQMVQVLENNFGSPLDTSNNS